MNLRRKWILTCQISCIRTSLPAQASIANSVSQVVEANKKVKDSLEPIAEKKSSEGTPRVLKKDEPKESMRLEISSGGRTTSAVVEQEVHSRFVKEEDPCFVQLTPRPAHEMAVPLQGSSSYSSLVLLLAEREAFFEPSLNITVAQGQHFS